MKLLVAIPALNEELSITSVIKSVQMSLPDSTILVIDDGSTDQTAIVAKSTGVSVISLPFNVGVGSALRVAFKFAVENKFDLVLQVDGDGQHIPSEAKYLLNRISENSIIIGSRFSGGTDSYSVSFPRRIAMTLLARILSKICKTKFTDVTSGFRLTSGKAIELFSNEYPRDYLGDTVESIILANKNQIKISEVAVQMNERVYGKPSQNLIRSMWYLGRILLVIFLALVRKTPKY